MPIEILQVDAFADRPFVGNPAAVCLLREAADARWMQTVAREMNLSETAFLVPRPGAEAYDLRWFTPAAEVDLCGHATLASAHVLYDEGHLPPTASVRFNAACGVLAACRDQEGAIALDFPAEPVVETPPPERLLDALGVRQAVFVGRNRLDWLIEVADAATLRQLEPDFALMATVEGRGAMVTAVAGEDEPASRDFVSRYFAPAYGIDEDPVTGSAHCALGPYWARKLGRSEVVGYQASARGGTVRVRCREGRVDLVGNAVTVLRAQLMV